MKKLNIPLLLILVVGTFALLVGLVFLRRYQVNRIADELVVRAEQAEKDGDLGEQLRLLGRYLRYRPKDVEQLKKMLKASREGLEESPNDPETVGVVLELYRPLQKAIMEHPEDVQLRRDGAWYAMQFYAGRSDDREHFLTEATDHLRQLETLGEMKPRDQVTLAQLELAVNDKAAATQRLSALVGFDPETKTFDSEKASNPDELSAYTALAEIFRGESNGVAEDSSLPDQIMQQMIDANPDSVDAYLMRIEYLQVLWRRSEDESMKQRLLADVETMVALEQRQAADAGRPFSVRVALTAAQWTADSGDMAKAKTYLEKDGEVIHKDSLPSYLLLSEIARIGGDLKGAIAYIEKGLEQLKLNVDLLFLRANLELDDGDSTSARRTLAVLEQQIGPRRYQDPRLELVRGRLLMADGDYPGAARVFERLSDVRFERATYAYYTRSRMVSNYLATCYARTGRSHLAEEATRQIMGTVATKLETANKLDAQGEYRQAIQILHELSQDEKLPAAYRRQLFFRMLFLGIREQMARPESQRNWSLVDQLAGDYLKQDGLSDRDRQSFQIELLIEKGQAQEARRRVESLVISDPDESRYWMLLNRLTTDNDAGLRILDQMEQRFGDAAAIRVARAERIAEAGGDNAVILLEELEADLTEKFSIPDQQMIWSNLRVAYEGLGAYDKAIHAAKQLVALDDQNVSLQSDVFNLAERAGNLSVMEESLDAIARIATKDSTEWKLAEAKRLIWLVKNEQRDASAVNEVRRLVESIRSQRSDWAPLYELQADARLLEKDYSGAIEAMETAVEKAPRDAMYQRRLVQLLIENGQGSRAMGVLATIPNDQKIQQHLEFEIANLAKENPAEALKKANALVPRQNDVRYLSLMANAQQAAGNWDQSLANRKRITEIAPKEGASWLSYVQALKSAGRTEQVAAVIEELEKSGPTEERPLLMAQIYSVLGDPDQAWNYLTPELEKRPKDAKLLGTAFLAAQLMQDQTKITEFADRLIALDGSEATETEKRAAAMARRVKAEQLVATGAYKDFLEALTLLEQNAPPGGELSGGDLMTWLRYCVNRPDASSRQRAIDRLKQVESRRKLSWDEKAILANAYKSAGRWSDAQKIVVDLLTMDPKNSLWIATYSNWLLERDDLAQAAVWIRKLDPASYQAVRLSSILQVRQGEQKEVASRLLAQVPQSMPKEQADNLRNIATLCEELGKHDPKFYSLAEQLWIRYVKMRPEQINMLIAFYARMPKGEKLGQVIQLCERQISMALKEGKPQEALAYMQLGVESLEIHKADLAKDTPYFDRLTKWFEVAHKAELDPSRLMSLEITFNNTRGDFERLEQLYRAYLVRTDVSDFEKAAMRNNLAFLLAVTSRGPEALQVIGDAIEQLGPLAALKDTEAMAYLASGQTEKALSVLQTIASSGEATPGIYFHLALAEYRSGNTAAAVDAFQKAQQMGLSEATLDPPEVPIYQKLLEALGPELKNQSSDLELSAR